MSHPVTTNDVITTAMFDGEDSIIPDTSYGTQIPVVIKSHDPKGSHESVTVTIGDKMFPASELEHVLDLVKKHQQAVDAFNSAKK